jgi:peptidoglycan/LPS O-acetylase OafA/YrhL
MPIGLSLYLDLLRFGLALTVMLGHASDPAFVGTSSFLGHFPRYGLTAVTGFFVLSGLVIARVSAGNEGDPRRYFAARVARIYSVVLPALVLTAVLDALGAHIDPHLYASGPIHLGSQEPRRYVLTAFQVQDFWIWHKEMTPGVNHPFWTLSYEVTYYVIFGLYLTRRRLLATAGTALLLLLAGPRIAALFPIWLFGVAVYYALTRYKLPVPLAVLVFIATAAGLYLTGAHRLSDDNIVRYDLDYAEGLLFASNMFAAGSMAPLLKRALEWCPQLVRWLGMLTFALYLCHRPLLYFFAALHVDPPGFWLQTFWLFAMTSGVVIVIAQLSERFRVQIREWLAVRRPVTVAGAPDAAGNITIAVSAATAANGAALESLGEATGTEPAEASPSPAAFLAGGARSLSAPGGLGVDR